MTIEIAFRNEFGFRVATPILLELSESGHLSHG